MIDRTEYQRAARTGLKLALLCAGLACGASHERPAASPPDLETFRAGRLQFPGERWTEVARPEEWGWSADALANARRHFEQLEAAALMVIHRGVLIAEWGDVDKRYNGASIRKALLGALIGLEVAAGHLDPSATLAELEIDDRSHPLTEVERTARVVDLLQARGGIYLPAVYESPSWKRHKPERGADRPGEAWFYSNWGFNALTTIYEQAAGTAIPEAFAQRIAHPIGMEDYREKDVHYLQRGDLTERLMDNDSEHPAPVFMISARDLGRFGLLYLARGRWGDEQLVPADWVERSLGDSVATHPALGGDRFGYMWWVSPLESDLGRAIGRAAVKATGGRGHKLVLVPELDLVVVHRLATGGVSLASQLRRRFFGSPSVSNREFNELMRQIVAAHPEARGGTARYQEPGALEPRTLEYGLLKRGPLQHAAARQRARDSADLEAPRVGAVPDRGIVMSQPRELEAWSM